MNFITTLNLSNKEGQNQAQILNNINDHAPNFAHALRILS